MKYLRRSSRYACAFALLLSAALWSAAASAEVTLMLKRSFIEKYNNRVTRDTNCIVDHTKGRPHSPSRDGAMHIAGGSSDIGLATVVEIMNAKHAARAVAKVQDFQGELILRKRRMVFVKGNQPFDAVRDLKTVTAFASLGFHE